MLLALARDEARCERQFGGGKLEGLAGDLVLDAVELEHDPPRLDARDPELRRSLAAAHADLGGLLRYRHIREDADPDAAGTADVARYGAARRLDLARRYAAGIDRLQPVGAEIERRAALGDTVHAALMSLAVFGAFGSQHLTNPRGPHRGRGRGRPRDARRCAPAPGPRPASCPGPSGRAPGSRP